MTEVKTAQAHWYKGNLILLFSPCDAQALRLPTVVSSTTNSTCLLLCSPVPSKHGVQPLAAQCLQ